MNVCVSSNLCGGTTCSNPPRDQKRGQVQNEPGNALLESRKQRFLAIGWFSGNSQSISWFFKVSLLKNSTSTI
ncbi:unnamed protein product [Caenorhabditis angaria]|uniref:Uncharacterized protein n=1 Tax=Caenorhabditis angaria TaxID=860376 RepID=A0A9P1MTZ8_9PELO|nr:unnamed protein product [Caenorhabditis angaria]